MGSITQATDRTLNRAVAMKILRHQGHEVSETRFAREAMVLARLEHPNIVPIHDFGRRSDGSVFYTMKLVRGETLGSILARIRNGDVETLKQYPLAKLLQVFRKMCDAMGFAHQQGIIHRDLKPENIMVGACGEVLVMDWGLAKVSGNAETINGDSETPPEASSIADGTAAESAGWTFVDDSTGDGTTDSMMTICGRFADQGEYQFTRDGVADFEGANDLTLDGSVMGTPQFMSPEQANGDVTKHDGRSDIYSLGAILYEILTLRPPVSGPLHLLLSRVINGKIDPPVSYNTPVQPGDSKQGNSKASETIELRHCPGGKVPAPLSAVVMVALAKRPEDRYQTVGDLLSEIDAWEGGFATAAEKIGALGQIRLLIERHRILAASAAILVLFSLAFVARLMESEDRATKGEKAANDARDTAISAQIAAEKSRGEAIEAQGEALTAKDEAVEARTTAEVKAKEARIALARANVALADSAWANHDPQTVRDYLDKYRSDFPEDVPAELRQSESSWRYLKSKMAGPIASLPNLTGEVAFWPGNESQRPAFIAGSKKSMASGFDELHFFDCETGEIQRTLSISGWQFAVSPDGKFLATGTRRVTVFDIETGEKHASFLAIDRIIEFEFSADSQHLYVVTENNGSVLSKFEIASNSTELWSLSGKSVRGSGGVGQIAVDPTGTWVAVHFMSSIQEVWLVDVLTGERVRQMEPGNSFIWNLKFNSDGTVLAAADFNGYATVWDIEDATVRRRLRAATGRMTCLGFTADDLLLTLTRANSQSNGGRSSTIRQLQVWELSSGVEIDSRLDVGSDAGLFSMNPVTGSVLCSGKSGSLWRFPIEEPTLVIPSVAAGEAGFLRDDFLICPARSTRELAVFDLRESTSLTELLNVPNVNEYSRLAVNPQRGFALIYVSSNDQFVQIGFDEDDGLLKAIEQPEFDANTFSFQFAQNSDRILSIVAGDGRSVRQIDAETGKSLATFTGPRQATCTAVAWVNDDRTAIGLFQDRQGETQQNVLICWDTETQGVVTETATEMQLTSPVYTLAASKDGRRFAIAGKDRSIEIYNAVTLESELCFRAHDGSITNLVFHPTLPIIASGSDDLSVRIWNVETGELLKTMLGPTAEIRSLAFNASGSLLACSSKDKMTRVWKVDGQSLLK